jgi:ribonuclease BN (tRNA processing enzyme)
VKVTLLGSGTSIPHPDRASPGLVLEIGDRLAVVDASSGSLHRMARHGLPLERVRWLLVTHFHPDHTGELGPILFALNNPEYFAPRKLTLVGPPGTKALYRKLRTLWGDWVRHDPERLEIRELPEGETDLDGWATRAIPVEHADPSVGYRFREEGSGEVVAYSGDTDYCPGVVEVAREAAVVFLECSHPDAAKVDGHLSPRLVGRVAREAGARRLVLVHMYPACDGHHLLAELRQSGFTGAAEVGCDGLRIEV